jgi:hypothetical protein
LALSDQKTKKTPNAKINDYAADSEENEGVMPL